MNYISMIIGASALIIWICSIQVKEKFKILRLQIIANTLYGIQYFILNAFTAVSMSVISIIRSIIFFINNKNGKNNSIILLIIFSIAIILCGIVTFNGKLYSIIPVINTLGYTYSTWQNNTKIIRVIFIIAAILWIYYNLQVQAYVVVIGNIIEIISGIIAIYKFDRKKQDKIKV